MVRRAADGPDRGRRGEDLRSR
ncbi:hypothetical protein LT493_19700 [Streptomyces tricolor]|nr:hypothetical protein [Streptomyces tricolor]